MNTIVIIAYIFTALNYVLYCASRFVKEKKTMLLLDTGAKILTISSLYLLGSLSGAYTFLAMFLSLILASIKEKKNIKFVSGFIFVELLYTLILILQFEGVSSILIFVSSSMTLVANWFFRPQAMRKMGLVVSIIYLGYQISIKNWAGLLEILVIIANIASFLKYKKEK